MVRTFDTKGRFPLDRQAREKLLEIINLLRSEGEDGWTRFFSAALEAYDRGAFSECADIILSGCGGMGSLDDLVLGQTMMRDGSFAWKHGAARTNEIFQRLIGELRSFALDVRVHRKG